MEVITFFISYEYRDISNEYIFFYYTGKRKLSIVYIYLLFGGSTILFHIEFTPNSFQHFYIFT